MKRRTMFLAAVAFAIATTFAGTSAKADSVDFSGPFLGPAGGTLSYTIGSPVSITGAPIEKASNEAGTLFDFLYGPVPSTFNFIFFGTGAASLDLTSGAETGNSTSGGVYSADFGPGGSITITGGTIFSGIAPGTTLLSGTFSSGHFATSAGSGTFSGLITGVTIHPTLLAALGLPILPGTGANTQVLISVTLTGGTYSGTVSSSDVAVTPIPEPATLSLLGMGLLGVAGAVRRKLRRSS